MTRRYGWILGLALLVFGRAYGQEQARPETAPAPEKAAPMPTAAPVAAEVFVEPAPPRARSYAGVEVLQWWFKRDDVPVLLLSGPAPTVARPAGTLVGTADDPLMRPVFPIDDDGGGGGLTYGTFSGLRASAGLMLGDSCWGIEGNAFALERRRVQAFFLGAGGTPYLTRPFFDASGTGTFGPSEASFETSTPPIGGTTGLNGSIAFDAQSRLYGWEANAAYYPDESAGKIFKLLVGYRQIELAEALRMTENVSPIQAGTALIGFAGTDITAPGQSLRNVDFFGASNHFRGPQVGATFRWGTGPFAFDLLAKIAVGANHETVLIAGSTTLRTGGVATATVPGGVFAVGSNSGFFSREEFAVAPEIGTKMSLDLCCWARMHIGYNLLYISSVVRPGTQIDRRINSEQVPSDVSFAAGGTPAFPRGWFRDTDFYAHGVNLGLEFMW